MTQQFVKFLFDNIENLFRQLFWKYLEKTRNFNAYRMILNSDTSNVQMICDMFDERKSVAIRNLGAGTIYVGTSRLITATSNSFPIKSGETLIIDHTTAEIYGIASSGSQQISVLVE